MKKLMDRRDSMNTHRTLLSLSTAVLIGLAFCQIAPAVISTTGNVEPDPATTTSADDLYVGKIADGSMTINGASGVINHSGFLGHDPGVTGTATVTGAGSTWSNSGPLIIGERGTGILNIENGGTVSNIHRGSLGYDPGSTGTATVTGTGSTWTNSGGLSVGESGTGTLNIQNGGALTVAGDLIVHRSSRSDTSNGTLNIQNGGVVTVAGGLTVGQYLGGWPPPPRIDLGTGTLNIQNGGSLSSMHGIIDWGNNTVTVTGIGSTWTNSENLFVGGTLNIENGGAVTVGAGEPGDFYISNRGELNILLASLSDPLLDVASDATIEGALNIALAGGFALNPGDLFTLIDLTNIASTLTGTFIGLAEGDSVGNFGGLDLFISYIGGDGNDVTLFTALSGDFDADGDIDGVDFGLWQSGYPTASGASLADGDADGDGDVDGTDFGIWQANYGTSAGAGAMAIPEPATLGVLIMGGLALLRRR